MKIQLFLIILLGTTHIFCANKPIKKHVIGCQKVRGFFSNFFAVLNHLDWSIKNEKAPIVLWDKESVYYNSEGYNGSFNVWEYYFEPLSDLAYDPNDKIYRNYDAPDKFRLIEHQNNPANVPDYELRKKINTELITPFIKVKSEVHDKMIEFYENNIKGKNTIGIHLRGTDKHLAITPVPVEEILQEANNHTTPDCQFFVATDENALLEEAKKQLNGPVIYYDSHRSDDGKPIHYKSIFKAQMGEEVLIEALLLAQCNKFIHTCSNVSAAVLLFNPELENILLAPAEITATTTQTPE